MAKLSKRHRIFIEEYLQCWSAIEAASRAGYRYPRTQGPKLFERYTELISERAKAKHLTMEEIEERVHKLPSSKKKDVMLRKLEKIKQGRK